MTLFRGFLSVSGLAFASRLLGLWRDVAIAAVFGAGAITDAFFAAFRLPNTLRRFTAEGALTQSFVPIYGEQYKKDPNAAATLAGEVAVLLFTFLFSLSVLAVVAAPMVIFLIAPGLQEAALAAELLQVVFPYVIFISLVALFSGMNNAHARFTVGAAAPLLLNVAMIASALWWAPFFERPIFALAWGVFIGGVLQLAWLIWNVHRFRIAPRRPPRLTPSPAARRVFRLFWHSALGAGAAQINLLINLFIASFFAAGSISWLYYADRLMELPAGLLGAALTTVALPALAAQAQQPAVFQQLLDNTLRLLLLLALPAAVGLALLALPLVCTLFMYGAFDAEDAINTQQAVLAYAIGVPGLVAVRPLAAAFFARQDAALPVRAAVVALVVTQLLNAVFIFGLDLVHVGLALSVGLAACANALVLYAVLWRRGWYVGRPGWGKFLLQLAAALAVMSAVLLWLTPPAEFWLDGTLTARGVRLTLCIAAAVTVYFAVLRLCGLRIGQLNHRLSDAAAAPQATDKKAE